MAAPNTVPSLYKSVVEDVINNLKEAFQDEGVDDHEQVLMELKQLWESKIQASKAVDGIKDEHTMMSVYASQQQQQQILQQRQVQQPTQSIHQQIHQIPQSQIQPQVIQPLQLTRAPSMSAPAQVASQALPAGIFQQQLVNSGGIIVQGQDGQQFLVQGNHLGQVLQQTPSQPQVTMTLAQVQDMPQQSRNSVGLQQLDGTNDSSSDDDDDDDDDDDNDDDDDQNDDKEDEDGEEEEPLNSGDDVSEDDPTELFDTDNVVVCQFDKISRAKNRWKFHLKDGIMNLNGKDFVFSKATGEADW